VYVIWVFGRRVSRYPGGGTKEFETRGLETRGLEILGLPIVSWCDSESSKEFFEMSPSGKIILVVG